MSFLNVCRFQPTAGGTTDWTYSSTVTGYQSPALAGVVNGASYFYRAESADLTQWEMGSGTYNTATGVLARTTVLYNSSGTGTGSGQSGAGSKISFTAVPQVAIVALKEDLEVRIPKNYIVNGAMQISQELGTAGTTVAGNFPVDMFYLSYSNAGTQTAAQVASVTPAGSPNRLRVTATVADAAVAAGDYCQIGHPIEGVRVADLRLGSASAKTVTLQFGVKAPAGTYSVYFENAATNRSYFAQYTISAGEANTDVIKSITVPLDQTGTWAVDNTVGIYVFFVLMAGSTFQGTANTWQAGIFIGSASNFNFMGTAGNVFELFDVSLTVGPNPPSFQVPDYAETLRACQRYFYNGVPPLKGVGTGGLSVGRVSCAHPVPMRIAPALTITAALPIYDGTTTGTITINAADVTATVLEFDATASFVTPVGRMVLVYQSGVGNINVSARMT